MKKKMSLAFKIIAQLIWIIFIVTGILLIVFSNEKFERNNVYLGSIIIVSAILPLFSYFAFKGYAQYKKTPALVFGSMSFIFGIVCIVASEITIDHICIIWGALTVLSCIYYIIDSVNDIKTNKLEFISIIINILELTFGIILIVNLGKSITLHIIIMGISFILKGLKVLFGYLITLKKEEVSK